MSVYCFWNNKGGTGKTTLSFEAITKYASVNPNEKILIIDMCPQANLSELLLGGLVGNGAKNLNDLYKTDKRKSVGGYFQERIRSPYKMPSINYHDFICVPYEKNTHIPRNIDLFAGDSLVELQASSISTQASNNLAGVDSWISVIAWIKDFLILTENQYDMIFIDSNPSFSIYTQIAIAASEYLIVPIMPDDSSRRALQNVFALVYGLNIHGPGYENVTFSASMKKNNCVLPKIKLIVKNRLTQYMVGAATAYASVFRDIDVLVKKIMQTNPEIFDFSDLASGIVEVRDFGTTGVISFAFGTPFFDLRSGGYELGSKTTTLTKTYINKCRDDTKKVADHLN